MEQVQGVSKLQRERVLIDLPENDQIRGFVLIFHFVTIVHQDEVLDGGLLDAATKIQRIGFQSFIPARLFIAQINYIRWLKIIEAFLLGQLI